MLPWLTSLPRLAPTSCQRRFTFRLRNIWLKRNNLCLSDKGCFFLEAPSGFGPENEGFADPCLTTWPQHHIKTGCFCTQLYLNGAGDEARTRYLHLGKVALYRMSYTRIMVPPVGVEPTTRGFSIRCSTYRATEAYRGEHKLTSNAIWRPGTDSNRRPPA